MNARSSQRRKAAVVTTILGAGIASVVYAAVPMLTFTPDDVSIGPISVGGAGWGCAMLHNGEPQQTGPVFWSFTDVSSGGAMQFRMTTPCGTTYGGPCMSGSMGPDSFTTVVIECVPQFSGIHQATLHANTSVGPAPASASLGLTCTATDGSGSIMITPANWNFGDVPVGTTQTQAFTVMNNTGVTLVDWQFQTGPGYLVGQPCGGIALCNTLENVPTGSSYPPPVEVMCAPTVQGPNQQLFTVSANSNTYQATATLDCVGSSAPTQQDINVSGDVFASATVGQQMTTMFFIYNEGPPAGPALQIQSIQVTGGSPSNWTINNCAGGCTIIGGAMRLIGVTYTATAIGDQSAVAEVRSNDPDENLVNVQLTGTGLGGVLRVAIPAAPTHQLDFGQVPTGISIPRQMEIHNDGNVVLDASIASGSIMVVQQPSISIPANGGMQLVDVICTPQAVGEVIESLAVNAPTGVVNPTTVPATGRCEGISSRIAITPTPYDFGDVPVGTSERVMISVGNFDPAQPAELRVPTLVGDTSDFVLVDPPTAFQPVAPQSTFMFAVDFQPASTGGKHVELRGLLPSEPERTVVLDGNGIDGTIGDDDDDGGGDDVTNYYACGCNADTGTGGLLVLVIAGLLGRRTRPAGNRTPRPRRRAILDA